MKAYTTNEASLFVPETWHDKSVTIFTLTAEGPSEFSFVITREEVSGDDHAYAYANRQVSVLEQMLPEFQMLERVPSLVGAQAAEVAEFMWNSETGKMRQRLTFVLHRGIALTITASAPVDVYPQHEFEMQQTLASLILL